MRVILPLDPDTRKRERLTLAAFLLLPFLFIATFLFDRYASNLLWNGVFIITIVAILLTRYSQQESQQAYMRRYADQMKEATEVVVVLPRRRMVVGGTVIFGYVMIVALYLLIAVGYTSSMANEIMKPEFTWQNKAGMKMAFNLLCVNGFALALIWVVVRKTRADVRLLRSKERIPDEIVMTESYLEFPVSWMDTRDARVRQLIAENIYVLRFYWRNIQRFAVLNGNRRYKKYARYELTLERGAAPDTPEITHASVLRNLFAENPVIYIEQDGILSREPLFMEFITRHVKE